MIIMIYGSPSYARLLMNTATIEWYFSVLFTSLAGTYHWHAKMIRSVTRRRVAVAFMCQADLFAGMRNWRSLATWYTQDHLVCCCDMSKSFKNLRNKNMTHIRIVPCQIMANWNKLNAFANQSSVDKPKGSRALPQPPTWSAGTFNGQPSLPGTIGLLAVSTLAGGENMSQAWPQAESNFWSGSFLMKQHRAALKNIKDM